MHTDCLVILFYFSKYLLITQINFKYLRLAANPADTFVDCVAVSVTHNFQPKVKKEGRTKSRRLLFFYIETSLMQNDKFTLKIIRM